jgi:hypothetical protein
VENPLLIHLKRQKHIRFQGPIQHQFMNNDILIEFWNVPVQRKKDLFIKNLHHAVHGEFGETKSALRPLRFSEKSIVHQNQLTQFKTRV